MYLFIKGKNYFVSLVPALFITYMVFVYILNAKIGFSLDLQLSFYVGIVLTVILTIMFFIKAKNNKANKIETDIIVERYYLPFRNTKLKGIRITDTDPIHAIVSFYNKDCILITSHEKPFWRGSPATHERPLEYKVILEASGKPEELCLIAKQQGMRPFYVFSDDSYTPGRKSIEPFRDDLALTNDKYYICVQLNAGNLDIDPVWILLSNTGKDTEPDFDFVDRPC